MRARFTSPPCPKPTANTSPSLYFHTLTNLSELAVTNRLPLASTSKPLTVADLDASNSLICEPSNASQ